MTLSNLTLTAGERIAELRRRNRGYEEKTVTPGAVADFVPEGWVVARESQSSVRLRRQRSQDEILENRFWCCLYRLGYPHGCSTLRHSDEVEERVEAAERRAVAVLWKCA